jgi:hypothetical protein
LWSSADGAPPPLHFSAKISRIRGCTLNGFEVSGPDRAISGTTLVLFAMSSNYNLSVKGD